MGKAVRLNRVESLEVKHGFEKAVGCGVAVDRRDDVSAEGRADRRLGLERVDIGLPDHLGRHLGTIEPLGHAVHDRRFQTVVMQDGRIDKGRKLGLATRDLLGLAADTRPYRVDLFDRSSPYLPLGHDRLPHSFRRSA